MEKKTCKGCYWKEVDKDIDNKPYCSNVKSYYLGEYVTNETVCKMKGD